jgi:hypothetical protein
MGSMMSTNQILQLRHLLGQRAGISVAEKSALRVIQRRLRQFVDARLLRRIEQPIFPDQHAGSKPYLYTLDLYGADLVSETLRIDLRPRD